MSATQQEISDLRKNIFCQRRPAIYWSFV